MSMTGERLRAVAELLRNAPAELLTHVEMRAYKAGAADLELLAFEFDRVSRPGTEPKKLKKRPIWVDHLPIEINNWDEGRLWALERHAQFTEARLNLLEKQMRLAAHGVDVSPSEK